MKFKKIIDNARKKISRVFFCEKKVCMNSQTSSNNYNISIQGNNVEYEFCKICTTRIVQDEFILYQMTIDKELIREVYFFKQRDHENANGNLFCTKRYNVKDKEPVVVYEHSPETLKYINQRR